MKENRKLILIAVSLVLVLLIATLSYNYIKGAYDENDSVSSKQSTSSESNADTTSAELVKAPDFEIYNENGEVVKLSQFIGKPVIINFWASWCGPCKSEMPVFEKIYKELGDEVVFLMVNLTDGAKETKESAKKYINESGFTFPIYYDSEMNVATVYGVYSIPTTLFVDSEGNIRDGKLGALTETEFKLKLSSIYKSN